MAGDIWALLGTNLLVMLVVMTLISIPSFSTRDPSYIDAFWGTGFVILALSSFLQTDGDGARKGWLLGLTALWGLRLSGYLFWRWRKHGPDPRYQAILATRTSGSEKVFIWRRVFIVQAFVLTLTALPVQLGQVYDDRLTALNVVGIVLALFGIAYETTADTQLTRFKADPANAGQVMDQGVWRYSRHPNYFGETCTWWGLFLLAVSNGPTVVAALGPAIITFFLLKVSGVTLLEKSLTKTKPKYVDYIATTSAFIPMPPKKKVSA